MAVDVAVNLHAFIFLMWLYVYLSLSLSFFFAFEQTYQIPTICKVPAIHLILMTTKWKVDILQMKKQ